MNYSKLANSPYESLRYKDARTKNQSQGYLLEKCPDHPACSRYGYVMQHRLVMEDHIGRFLTGQEVVHHIDNDKKNNVPENLLLFPNQSMHMVHHQESKDLCYNKEMIDLVRKAAPGQSTGLGDLGVNPKTVAKICCLYDIQWTNPQHTHLTEGQVRDALRGRTTLEAAEFLGCSHQTLRNNWDHLLKKRKSPVDPDDPKVIQLVRDAAADPDTTYAQLAKAGVSAPCAKNICEKHQIEWLYYQRGSNKCLRKKSNRHQS